MVMESVRTSAAWKKDVVAVFSEAKSAENDTAVGNPLLYMK